MTPRTLASKIAKLPATLPITTAFERELRKLRTWGTTSVWYSTQKEHWLGWLEEYGGPGYYARKDWNRDAEFVYNHIVCPPMVLWLGEAFGVSPILVRKGKKAAFGAQPTLPAQSAAIRRVIPWGLIEETINGAFERASRAHSTAARSTIDKITTTIKRQWLREIAAGRKRVEYREIKPYWTKRLSRVKPPFELRLINGMQVKAPEITVLVRSVGKNVHEGCFELHIGKIISLKNWNLRREQPTNRAI
jgi:hypothetical protein